MTIRKPAVAGQFYGATKAECIDEIKECLPKLPLAMELPETIVGAIVPHAGWVFSGDLAGLAFSAIGQANEEVDTFILFGAAHRYINSGPAVYDEGCWQTPLGLIEIDEALAAEMVGLGARADKAAHSDEHSIEVQVPFVQYLFPKAKIVPVAVPTEGFDWRFGSRVGQMLAGRKDSRVVCVASTDLTHYGPRYGFCPQGTGATGLKWARQVNDVAFINLAVRMEADKMVEEAMDKGNACGPAAAAAVVAAAAAMGRGRGVLLGHTTSDDVMRRRFGKSSEESVGYAAIVY